MIPEQKVLSLRTLCTQYTDLSESDISQLEIMAGKLSFIAELTGTDIFIDALTSNGVDAIVLAWAHPLNTSAYRHNVVGEVAYATQEPAVYQVFKTTEMVRNVRGVNQEGGPIDQTVVPLRNERDRVIGVLIMERDISKEIRQEEQVKFLSQTAEQLSSKLMSLSMTGFTWEEWLGNGIFVINRTGQITYANKNAERMYREYCGIDSLGKDLLSLLSYPSLEDLLKGMKIPIEMTFRHTSYLLQAHPLLTCGAISGCVVSFKDVTELRQKERELNAQSTLIREIHHRVKNNLHNVVALLRLQMGHSESAMVKMEFEACINRILSIARVHDVFAHQSWDYIDLLELAEHIVTKMVENFSLPSQQIKTTVQGQPVQIPASQAVPIALVINELVTNSLKHGIQAASYGEISILIEESAGNIYMLLADSGAGPLPACSRENGQLGLYIVRLLICEQLEGSFSLERCGGATVAKVSFLLRKEEKI
jgi:two-component sensor histidine kinase